MEYRTRHTAVSFFKLLVPDVSSSPTFSQMLGQRTRMNSLSVLQKLREALPEHLRVKQRLGRSSVRHRFTGDCSRASADFQSTYSPEGKSPR